MYRNRTSHSVPHNCNWDYTKQAFPFQSKSCNKDIIFSGCIIYKLPIPHSFVVNMMTERIIRQICPIVFNTDSVRWGFVSSLKSAEIYGSPFWKEQYRSLFTVIRYTIGPGADNKSIKKIKFLFLAHYGRTFDYKVQQI